MTPPEKKSLKRSLLVFSLLLAGAAAIYISGYDHTLSNHIRAFSRSVGKTHIFQEILNLFRPFGKGDVILVIVAGLGICGARKRATHIILALLIMTALIWPIKIAVGRERPGYKKMDSFPSGDAATAAAFCAPLVSASPWGVPMAVILNAGVATGRVYDGRHYPSDVLTGIAFGVLASALAAIILRRWPWKLRRRWFFIIGGILTLFSVVNLSWARATPFVLDFFRVWGPLGAFLILARLVPVWLRKKHATGSLSRTFLLLALLISTVYLSLTTASSLWDRDEPRFSRATIEMVESGNYLFPTFNNQLRPDKPILIYWLMSIPVRILGVSELSCRMVAPIATLLTAFLTFWLARRLFNQKIAFGAGLILMLTPLMTVSGTAATTDALLLFFITGAITSFMLSWLNGFRLWHLVLLILTLAGALLTKGPVGLAVPLLVISALLIFTRNNTIRPWHYAGWFVFAILSASLLFLSWALPANEATQGEFLRLGIGKHVVNRSLTAMESHGGRSIAYVFYYVPVVILAFFPWILYLPRVLSRITASREPIPGRQRIVFLWALPVLILMSLVATKLPHYILPAWPALALGASLGLHHAIQTRRAGNSAWTARLGFGLFITIGLVLGISLTAAPWILAIFPLFGIRVPLTVIGTVFLIMTIMVWKYYRCGLHEYVAGILGAGMLVILLSASLFLLPQIERMKLSPQIAQSILINTTPQTPVATCGYGEPSLNFYIGRSPIVSLESSDLPKWAQDKGAGALIVTDTRLGPHRKLFDTPRIETLDVIHGFNYSRGKQVQIYILYRNTDL